MKKFAYLAVLGLAAGIGAYLLWGRPPLVDVAAVRRGSAAEVVYATGVVEPVRWAKVTPLVTERIVEMCNCEGDQVAQGDQLAKLDDKEARATLAELEARRDFLTREVERYSALLDRRVVSAQTFERTSSELSQVEALAAAQRAKLDNYVLRAPLDGAVLRQDGEVGEIATPGNVLFWVGRPKPLNVVAEVNEEDIPRIRTGQTALVRADAFPEKPVDAQVQRITPKGDPVTKTYRIYLSLPDQSPLMIGMTTEVNVVLRTVDDTLLVPLEALSGNQVFVVDAQDRIDVRQVTVGIRGTRMAEITAGLEEGARVVSPVDKGLRAGQRVRVGAAGEAR